MKSVVLLSGGLDSTLALALSSADVALSFDYGQTHRTELERATKIANHYGVWHDVVNIERLVFGGALTGFGEIPEQHAEEPDATEVPGRNLVMISAGVAYAKAVGYGAVVIGANRDDHNGYPDCRPEFIDALRDATHAGYGIELHAPLIRMTKRDIVVKARELNVPLDLTWSCYRGGAEPCNRCGACQSRNEAMA